MFDLLLPFSEDLDPFYLGEVIEASLGEFACFFECARAVLLVFATQENKQTLSLEGDTLTFLTLVSVITTFVAFSFSTFAFGLSADFFRKSAGKTATSSERKAAEAFRVGGHFFEVGYFTMMWSLFFVLAHVHLPIGLFGLTVFAVSWAYLYIKTGPYKRD